MQTTPTKTKEKHVLAETNSSLSKHRKHNKTLGIMGCMLIGVLVIANVIVFVRNMSSRTEVAITNVHFSKNMVDISAGDSIPFKNTTRTTYSVCLGQNAVCIASGNGPAELYRPGMVVPPGKTSSVTFVTPGTYTITALHSGTMNLVVKVAKAEDTSSSGGDTNDSIIIVPENSTLPSDTNSSSTNNNTSTQQNTNDNNSNVTSPSNSGSDDENSGSSGGSGDDGGDSGGGSDGGDGGD